MAGRNDTALVNALQTVSQAMQHQPNASGNDGSRVLETFQRNHPPIFKSRFDNDRAQVWLKDIERIFFIMDFTEV